MSEPQVQRNYIPVVEGFDNRMPSTADIAFGFVYFSELNYEGQQVRVGYVGGGERTYLFQANWGTCHAGHFAAAWEALSEGHVPGYSVPDGAMSLVSINTGDDDNPGSIMLGDLKNVAIKEHRKFVGAIKKLAKTTKATRS